MTLQERILIFVIEKILQEIPKDRLKLVVDQALDHIEDQCAKSETKIDDIIIVPIIKNFVRDAFNIPDNDPKTNQ
jgi:hypothetical protein